MALDEAGMQQVIDQLVSLFSQQNEVNTYGSDPQGWVDEHLPAGTEPADLTSCMPHVADRLGGAAQQNLAGYTGTAAPATGSVINEISYTYNTTYQQNAFIYAEEGAQVSNIQGDGNTVSQTQIDQSFEVGDGEDHSGFEPEGHVPGTPLDPGDGTGDDYPDLPPGDGEPEGDIAEETPDQYQPEPEPEPEPEAEPEYEIAREDSAPDSSDGGLPGDAGL